MDLIRERSTAALIVAMAMAGGLSACKGHTDYEASGDTLVTRTDSAAGSADSSSMAQPAAALPNAVAPTSPMADAAVLGDAWAANTNEIALGKLGETKATNAAVKAFARQMVVDHRAMLAETKSLATTLSLTADTTANDAQDFLNGGRNELSDMTGMPAGADWDKAFMDHMVDDHQKVLDKLQDAAKNTSNADLRSALEKTAGRVQAHLTKAQDVKAQLKS